MIVDDVPDRVVRSIDGLVVLTPDQRRAEQFRERCRCQLRRASKPASVLGPVLITSVGMIFLCALVLDLLRLRGLL